MYVQTPAIEGVEKELASNLAAPPTAPPALGTFARVQHEVNKILSSKTVAARWGVHGSLTPADIKIEHPGPEIANRFRQTPLKGFGKSNVFALDIAWRSGFHVPLVNVGTTNPEFIYPLANMLTTYAERAIGAHNVLLTGADICSQQMTWGSASTPLSTSEIHNRIAGRTKGGSGMFILVGWRRSGTGHVGIISRIWSIKHKIDANSFPVGILEIIYDGWEATTDGAKQVTKRHWSTVECKKVANKCPSTLTSRSLQNFCTIHIIGLRSQLVLCNRGVEVPKTDVCTLA